MARTVLLVLCLGLLSSCGRKQADGTKELILLTPGGYILEACRQEIERFEADHPGVRVKLVSTPGKDYYVKSLTMLAGRAHVDALWLGHGFGNFSGRGALLNLDPYVANDPDFKLSAFNPGVVDWYRQEGALYGLPYGLDLLVIAYNQDLFDAAGIPYPDPDWTVEDLITSAKKLTRESADGRRLDVAGLGFENLNYRYHGLSLLTDNDTRFGLNTPEGLRWLQRNISLIHVDHVLQRGADKESMDRLSGFLNQRVAIIELATWEISQVHATAPFRWDIVAIPTGTNGGRLGWASSSGFSIARNAKYPDLAWQLLKRLSGEAFQRRMLTTNIPTIESLQKEYLSANPAPPAHISEVLRMVDHLQPDSRITAFQEVSAEWKYWQDRALMQDISAQKALTEAESHVNRILELHRQETRP